MGNFKKTSVASVLAFTLVLSSYYFNINGITNENEDNKLIVNAVNFEDSKTEVILGGDPFGIKLFTDGVVIVEINDITIDGSVYSPAKNAELKVNDIITNINGEKVISNEQLGEEIKKTNGDPIKLTVRREDNLFETTLTPVLDENGNYRAGMWIRDSSAGIGTITFYNVTEGYFAALGHGICDTSTGLLMPLSHGEAVKANITSITKGEKGTAGGLNGYFNDTIIGDIITNCEYGIYGKIDQTNIEGKKIQVANTKEIKTGKAVIVTTLDDKGPKEYEVVIEYVDKNSNNKSKNFVIQITDKELLEQTGGIVQGMSGSPIIQNGKLVGAVTHVFLNEPDKGFGIFALNMLENFEENNSNMYDAVA